MNLSDLRKPPGARKRRKRVGRGMGSGLGKTCGRGHKGQKSRSGGGTRPGFEGGQMPLLRRLPKRGFRRGRFATPCRVINVGDLRRFEEGSEVTPETLRGKGLVKALSERVKILGEGNLEKPLAVRAHAFSHCARKKIEAAGGTCEIVK